ncbi:concanavalin A-like lectin/glucanase [Marasmius fiardii PR-910]|nr:concanavalin A-like lectin/glucanase [Marasmius fiardii PR-910]
MAQFTMKMLLGLVFIALAPVPFIFAQNCQCGYRDSNGNVWREAVISTFTQSEGALAAVQDNWMISNYSNPQGGTATANIQYLSANVMQHNDALGLKASAYDNSGSVKSAEIVTHRSDFLYGTFRIRAQVPSVPGAVFGFFTYFSNTQEQDIEFLSAEPDYYQRVHYTNHPGQDPGATLDTVIPGADFTYGKLFLSCLPVDNSRSKQVLW